MRPRRLPKGRFRLLRRVTHLRSGADVDEGDLRRPFDVLDALHRRASQCRGGARDGVLSGSLYLGYAPVESGNHLVQIAHEPSGLLCGSRLIDQGRHRPVACACLRVGVQTSPQPRHRQ
jgi:hypothetical protein